MRQRWTWKKGLLSLVSLLPTAAVFVGLAPCVFGQQAPPQAAGLAARYPGDRGIEKDPSVIFAEGFEGKNLPTAEYGKPGGFYDLNGYPKLMYLTGNCRYDVCGLLLRDAAHSDIKWDRFMFGPRYGGKGYKEGPPREQKSWIDGLVVSRRYVGPARKYQR